MKCRIILDGLKGIDAKGVEIEVAKGTEIEHHEAYRHCLPNGDSPPRIYAEPADEECAAKVAAELKLINFIKTGK